MQLMKSQVTAGMNSLFSDIMTETVKESRGKHSLCYIYIYLCMCVVENHREVGWGSQHNVTIIISGRR